LGEKISYDQVLQQQADTDGGDRAEMRADFRSGL
jgi:hypothetical protein